MPVQMTAAEFRRLGIEATPVVSADPPAKSRVRRAPFPFHTRCVLDGEEFTTQASEDRHFKANPTHRRYEGVLE